MSARASWLIAALTLAMAGAALCSDVLFEENLGQLPAEVQFLARMPGLYALVCAGEILLVPELGGAPVTLRLAGARSVPACGEGGAAALVSSFVGNDRSRWVSGAPAYRRVVMSGVRPGVDLVLRDGSGGIELDLLLDACAGREPLVLEVGGSTTAETSLAGEVRIGMCCGSELRIHPPVVYQSQRVVDASWRMIEGGDPAWERVELVLGDHDRDLPLFVDPVISYSTYLGGSNYDDGKDVFVDAAGNAYLTGESSSMMDFPMAGPWSPPFGGPPYDAFVTKVDPTGTLIWSLWWGGDFSDYPNGVFVDGPGAVYVTGHTQSAMIPLVNPFQASPGSGTDGFVFKINPAGTALEYSTFLGGNNEDVPVRVAADALGNAVVVGRTQSTNFPLASPVQMMHMGGTVDCFVTKLAPTGSTLVYSTYLGGSGFDTFQDVVLDAAGNAYMSGLSGSTDFPVVSPLQPALAGGIDALVAAMTPAGSVIFATWLGGSDSDDAPGIDLTPTGDIVIAGHTMSTDLQVTAGVVQPTYGGGGDLFVAQIDATGATLDFASYYGGSGSDLARAVAVDPDGNIHAAGRTTSTDLVTVSPVQPSLAGAEDVLLVAFDSTASRAIFASYWGGSASEYCNGNGVAATGQVTVVGHTTSTDYPTVAPLQAAATGGRDACVISYALDLGLCGDCNGDGVVSILDALVAARHASGLLILTGGDFTLCNVTGLLEPDPAAVVDILDALAIAQFAAGLPVTLVCA